RARQDREVEAQAPAVDVLEVESHPLLEGQVVAPTDLPQAGEARSDAQTAAEGTVKALGLPDRKRPRTHEAHVAEQDVEELRQLVEAGAAQEPAESRDPRVVVDLETGAVHLGQGEELVALLLRADTHGAELQHAEGSPVEPAPLLGEQHRAARSQ